MYPLLCSISSKVWNYQRYNEERKSNKDRQWNGLKPNPEGQWYLHRKPKIEQSESNKKSGGIYMFWMIKPYYHHIAPINIIGLCDSCIFIQWTQRAYILMSGL